MIFRGSLPVHNPLLDVIAHGWCVVAVGLEVVLEGRLDVQHVDDDGAEGHDSLIHRCSRPGRPTALGTPGHDIGFHSLGSPGRRRSEGADRIHGADHRFGHRQAGRPPGVTGAEVLVPGVGNEVVLDALLAVAVEDQRLIGDHLQLHHHRASRLGDPGEFGTGLGKLPFPVGPSSDDQQGRLVRQVLRAGHGQPMFPQCPVHLVGREPRLGSQVDDGDLTTAEVGGRRHFPGERGVRLGHIPAEVGGRRHFPGERGVRLGHIPVEGCFWAVERGRIGSGPGAGQKAAHGQQASGDQKKAGRSGHRPQGAIGRRPGNAGAMGVSQPQGIDLVPRGPSPARSPRIPPDVASSGEPVTLR